ncbi:MAG: cysteine desulfurase family protein [Pseudomonadota bacterium]
MIYLDYNATTPLDGDVVKAISEHMSGNCWGNPSSSHPAGVRAKEVLESARRQVSDLLRCRPGEIVFTSGGTESNNAVLMGVACSLRKKGRHFVTSSIEHPSILQPALFLLENGWDVTFLPVDGTGMVSADDLRKAIRPDTVLISIMHANNETGTVQPIVEMSSTAREHGILFHTDAAQTAGKIETAVDALGVDFLTMCGHKLYAPKGIGILYVREGVQIEPLIHGSGQEAGRRPGTENVMLAVGLGTACVSARRFLDEGGAQRERSLRELVLELITSAIPEVVLNGHREERLPNTLNISFPGLNGGEIIGSIPEVCASTGAACHDRSVGVSHVLSAMGVSREVGMGVVRLSVGRPTTEAEIREAARLIVETVKGMKRG